MKRQVKEIRQFFYSQPFADGIRTTIAVLLPALIMSYFDLFMAGLTISLGSLCVSLADTPGPIIHRKNGMLFCIAFVVLVALITSLAQKSMYTMGLEILLFSFFFSMFNVYGNRAAFVGSAALLVMILTMDNPVPSSQIFLHSFLILAGGAWYMSISLLLYHIQPYRTSQRALGECIRELAIFLRIKADFYNPKTNLEDDYHRLVTQQIVVSEKQDLVRELLFKTREIVKESTPTGRKLLLTFVNTVDLFEDITATYYDYTSIRKQFAENNILPAISLIIIQIAEELDNIGIAIQTDTPYKRVIDYDSILIELKNRIDEGAKGGTESNGLVLKKILVNLRMITKRLNDILQYFDTASFQNEKTNPLEYKRFVGHQSLDPKLFWNNLTFSSSVFRHSFRVAVACIVGFIVAKFIAYGHHSYWIIMTTVFMLKPAFSLTKQRNYERIIGTLAGGLIGVIVLLLTQNKNVLFTLMVLFMIGTYSFQRNKYLVSVICMTPFILIFFHFLGVEFMNVIQERILDTVIGCLIALLSGYLLFPNWESENLTHYLQSLLQANKNYLQKAAEGLAGKKINIIDYKLVRKEVYVSSANLSAAFQRMLSEPKSKQKKEKEIHQFVVLNHILFSNIATVAAGLFSSGIHTYPDAILHTARKAISELCKSLRKFDENCNSSMLKNKLLPEKHNEANSLTTEEKMLKEQFDFIYKLSQDIHKTTTAITAV